MTKSSQAFRTIREVAEWLDVATHVLRFWESKFPQIKPVKRAGGRRYYRPADMELIGGIKVLLHDRGMTIRGVQRMIREAGVASVAALTPPLPIADTPMGDVSEDWTEDRVEDVILREAAIDRPLAVPALHDAAPQRPRLAVDAETAAAPLPVAPSASVHAAAALAVPDHAAKARSSSALARLGALVGDPARMPHHVRATLRPALVALRDRMRA